MLYLLIGFGVTLGAAIALAAAPTIIAILGFAFQAVAVLVGIVIIAAVILYLKA